jgi:hypothetical protein
MQWRIFGPKRDEVKGGYRKLHNEELYILYSSPNIFRMIKKRRMISARHAYTLGEEDGMNWIDPAADKDQFRLL